MPQLSPLENMHLGKFENFNRDYSFLTSCGNGELKKKFKIFSVLYNGNIMFFIFYFSQDHISSIKSLLAKSAETSSYACVRDLPSAEGEKLQGCTLLVMTGECSEKIPVLLTEAGA